MSVITAKQLAEWKAFYAVDPWGEQRGDLRSALVGMVVAGTQGKKVELRDLMLFDDKPRPTAEQVAKAKVQELKGWFSRKAKLDGGK